MDHEINGNGNVDLFSAPASKGELAAICIQLSLALQQVALACMHSTMGNFDKTSEALQGVQESSDFFAEAAERIYGTKLVP